MDTSGRSSESKGYEEARMGALRQLTEMINGVAMSGSTQASMTYITVTDGDNSRDFSRESFVDVVNTSFRDNFQPPKSSKKRQI